MHLPLSRYLKISHPFSATGTSRYLSFMEGILASVPVYNRVVPGRMRLPKKAEITKGTQRLAQMNK